MRGPTAAAAAVIAAALGAAAAGAEAGEHTACMQATSATHFMAFVVPGAGSSAAAAPVLHAPKASGGRTMMGNGRRLKMCGWMLDATISDEWSHGH